jgi:hypothetical protein
MGRLAAACALALLLAAPAGGQARSYSIDAYRVSIQVDPDASLLVQESITFVFRGSHRGIYRTIPLRYARHGLDYALRVEGVQVLGPDGQPLRTELSYPGRALQIKAWVPGARDATRTVTILYRVQRALLAFESHDELYWNAIGTDWAVPIRSAEAVVGLPPTVPAEEVRATAFTGPFGGAGREYTLERAGGFLVFRTTRPLGMREGLTVVVGWPPGHVRFPSGLQALGWFLLDQRWFGLPLAVFAGCLLFWRRFGRDPMRDRSVKPEYEPPAGLRPGEAGALLDEVVHPRDIVATLVDLAVRGHLGVEQVTTAFGESDYLFKLTKPWLGEPDLADFEVIVLAQVFGAGGTTHLRLLSELRRDSRVIFEPIRRQLYRGLVKKKYFLASPEAVRNVWRTVGGILLVAAVFLGVSDLVAAPLSAALAVGASGAIVLGFARVMPRKTFRGAREKLHILGFQEFLERAEKDRLRRLPSDTLHKWLPYAIALGVEEAWIWNFEGITVAAPTWYESKGPFTLSTYSRALRTFARDVETAWLSAARGGGGSSWSGGGSGFSGGSSGGGGGGGGGGTF